MENRLNGILSRLIKLIFNHPKFVNSFIPVCMILLCRVIPTSEHPYFLIKLLFMLCKLIQILSLQNNSNIERLSVAIQIDVISLKCSFYSLKFV